MVSSGSARFLIWSAVRPLLLTYIIMLSGFALAKAGLFPRSAARGASQISVRVALPALIFSNIVPSINSSNVSALGPLISTAFLYQAIGFLCGILIRELTYVPRDFQVGIVVATMLSNWGNLPLLVVNAVMEKSPFASGDSSLGQSYLAMFILTYNITFWMLGAARSISWDYRPGVPHGKDAEVKIPLRERKWFIALQRLPEKFRQQRQSGFLSTIHTHKRKSFSDKTDVESAAPVTSPVERTSSSDGITAVNTPTTSDQQDSTLPVYDQERLTKRTSAALSEHAVLSGNIEEEVEDETEPKTKRTRMAAFKAILHPIISNLLSPVNISLVISIVIALVNPLKALFTEADHYHFAAPDGDPPLAFVLSAAKQLGNIAVPLGVFMLGASFAEMKIPRPLSRLPWLAMTLVTATKMILIPIIGIFLCKAYVSTGFVAKSDYPVRFIIMFLSGTPSAVNQVIVAQLVCGDHGLDTLSAFLLFQYIFMLVASSCLVAVSLKLL